MDGLIISSDLEGLTRNKNKENILPDKLASFPPIIASAIDNIRNIKCKRPDIDAIYVGMFQKLWSQMQTETS